MPSTARLPCPPLAIRRIIENLNTLRATDAELAKEIAAQIYDNAMVAAGFIEDPREMVGRLYKLLERLSAGKPGGDA